MPRPRKTTAEIENEVNKYGYYFIDGVTNYRNYDTRMTLYDAQTNQNVNLSLRQLRYRIRTNKRSEYDVFNILNEYKTQPAPTPRTREDRYRDFVQIEQIMNVPVTAPDERTMSGFDRFARKFDKYPRFANLSISSKNEAYMEHQQLTRLLSAKRKFSVDLSQTNNKSLWLFSFVEAIQAVKKRMNKRIKIKVQDVDGHVHFYTLSLDTIDYFKALLEGKTRQEIHTSLDDIYDNQEDWLKLDIIFEDFSGHHGGFFPFINKLKSLDLSKFGIYNEINYENYKNNCFIDALINSGKFNEEQIKLIKSSVYTRLISLCYIQEMCDLMKINVTVRIPNEEDNKTSAKIFKSKDKANVDVVMMLYYDHFMINDNIYCTEYYIEHHEEIDAKYATDMTRFTIYNDNGDKRRSKMNIIRLIKCLRKNNLLEPIPDEEQMNIARMYKHFKYTPTEIIPEYFRPIIFKDKNDKQCDLLNDKLENNGYKLFGEKIEDKRILNNLYNQLQNVIDDLGVEVRARNYNKFPELMNKIMFEFGCFENVYEMAQPVANNIRSTLIFPRPHTADDKPFYSNKKLYYVDINSAYLSVIDGIPTGRCNVNGTYENMTREHSSRGYDVSLNTKIVELIKKLYNIRKSHKNNTIKKCLKLMMASCWGSSIKRNRLFERKIVNDENQKEQIINKNINHVMEYDENTISILKSITFNYSYPQFAQRVLENYHKKMDEVRKLVTPFYENIDAILITQSDYEKLIDNGLVGDELGKFKIERVFTEIAIASPRKYVATLENGEKFIHLAHKDVNSDVSPRGSKSRYDSFVDDVKNNSSTTIY